jgi:hypothetical protein
VDRSLDDDHQKTWCALASPYRVLVTSTDRIKNNNGPYRKWLGR